MPRGTPYKQHRRNNSQQFAVSMFLSLQLSLGSPKVFSPSNLMEFWFLATVALLLACSVGVI